MKLICNSSIRTRFGYPTFKIYYFWAYFSKLLCPRGPCILLSTYKHIEPQKSYLDYYTSMERYVPEELCFYIFLNLPVKSILRFKCVCKSWNKIFSTKSFSYSYLVHKKSSSNTKKYLLFEHDDFYSAHIIDGTKTCYNVETMNYMGCYRPIFSETGPQQYENCFLKVYGICNGLLCLSDGQLRLKSTIYLWNPVARRKKNSGPSSKY